MTMSIDWLQMARRPSGLSRALIGARLKSAIFNRHSTTAIANPTPQIDSLNPQIDNRQSTHFNPQSQSTIDNHNRQSTISTDNRQSQSASGSRQTGNHHSAVRNR
jgi:hypothetical protein